LTLPFVADIKAMTVAAKSADPFAILFRVCWSRLLIMSLENPFHKIRARGLLLWMTAGTLASLVFLGVLSAVVPLDEQLRIYLLVLLIYFWMALWVFRKARRNRVDFRRLFRRSGPLRIRQIFGLVLGLTIFSIGAVLLLDSALSHVSPRILAWVTRPHPQPSPSRLVRVSNLILNILISIVLAPLIEEVLFRGFLLNRWATKWGLRAAILAAAVVFGAMHIDGIIGASLFAVCMSLLYLKTRALWAPMVTHGLNNAVAISMGLLIGKHAARSTEDTLIYYKSFPWLSILLLTISTPFLVAFIYRNWPDKKEGPPYRLDDQADESIVSSAESEMTGAHSLEAGEQTNNFSTETLESQTEERWLIPDSSKREV
jgi:membrane protease YdiL (CAAX protease family)